jgi:4-hydroxybenzoate polyprenyltransferase
MKTVYSILQLHLIGCCAVALLWQTQWLLPGSSVSHWAALFAGSGAIFGYYCTHPVGWQRVLAWVWGLVAAYSFVAWHQNGGAWATVLPPVFLWLAYYGFQRPGQGGLRHSAMAKPFTVALAWAWVTVVFAVEGFSRPLFWMFLERSAFVFALALAYDVHDWQYDQQRKLITLAQKLGRNTVFPVMYLALGLSGMAVAVQWGQKLYPWRVAQALLAALVAGGLVLHTVLRAARWRPWHKPMIDALMLFPWGLMLLLRLHCP